MHINGMHVQYGLQQLREEQQKPCISTYSDIGHRPGIVLLESITGDLDWNYMLQQRDILVMMTE